VDDLAQIVLAELGHDPAETRELLQNAKVGNDGFSQPDSCWRIVFEK
jgi:hypothetical protein